jgi:hypothetical protein
MRLTQEVCRQVEAKGPRLERLFGESAKRRTELTMVAVLPFARALLTFVWLGDGANITRSEDFAVRSTAFSRNDPRGRLKAEQQTTSIESSGCLV